MKPVRSYVHSLKVPKGCTVEPTQDALQFLASLFEKHDEDKDNCLSPVELTNLMSVCPANSLPMELGNMVRTNEHGFITYDGFMSFLM